MIVKRNGRDKFGKRTRHLSNPRDLLCHERVNCDSSR